MRNIKIIGLAAALLVASASMLPAQAQGKKVRREVSAEYVLPAGVSVNLPATGDEAVAVACKEIPSCLTFSVPEGATTVDVEIVDRTGLTALGLVGGVDSDGEVCGSSKQPLVLETPTPKMITITLATGACANGTPSLVTAGTVTATFTSGPTE